MTWQLTWYTLPPLLAAVLSAALCAYAWQYRSRPVTPPFLALMVAIALWSLASAVQFSLAGRGTQLLFLRVGITVGATIPTIWFVLTLRYAKRAEWLTRGRTALLALEPAAFTAVLWTNPAHQLVWETRFDAGPPAILDFVPGPGYILHIGYAYLLVLAGIALLLNVFLTSSRLHRRQAGLLVLGAVVPLGANVLFTLGFSPVPNLDLTTSSFTVTGVVFALSLFRYDLVNLTPVAYRNVSSILGDGVVIFDDDGTLVEYNDHAERVLDASLSNGQAFAATPLHDIVEGSPDGTAAAALETLDGTVFQGMHDGTRRFYEVNHAVIHDRRDNPAGHLVVVRDVTATKEYEQRLEVTNRILRHNLRNELTIILGQADTLQSSLRDGHGEVQRIVDAARRLDDVSNKARRIQESMRQPDEALVPVDVVPVAERVVERWRDRYPAADVALDAPGRASVLATDVGTLETALSNVVENALEHNDREDPTVEVSVAAAEEWVTVSVADDGPGIPRGELDPIQAERETQLEHTSSLGLWLVNWAVSGVGGEVAFEDNDPRGTVVRLRFQRADESDAARQPA